MEKKDMLYMVVAACEDNNNLEILDYDLSLEQARNIALEAYSEPRYDRVRIVKHERF